ncbi:MAG: hypothetical protein CL521_04950 [Actinobacteria bacterium]|nr:hypothetical protein [Actinomycetota bacterium]
MESLRSAADVATKLVSDDLDELASDDKDKKESPGGSPVADILNQMQLEQSSVELRSYDDQLFELRMEEAQKIFRSSEIWFGSSPSE